MKSWGWGNYQLGLIFIYHFTFEKDINTWSPTFFLNHERPILVIRTTQIVNLEKKEEPHDELKYKRIDLVNWNKWETIFTIKPIIYK